MAKFVTQHPDVNSEHYNKHYIEAAQRNPIRWQMVLDKGQKDDGELYAQTNQFKCKDYFNDMVCAVHHGKYFSVYGFHNQILTNKTFLGVVAHNIAAPEVFKKNVNYWMNFLDKSFTKFEKSFQFKFQDVVDTPNAVYFKLKFDRHLYNNFITSLVTWFIRVSNTKDDLVGMSLEDLITRCSNSTTANYDKWDMPFASVIPYFKDGSWIRIEQHPDFKQGHMYIDYYGEHDLHDAGVQHVLWKCRGFLTSTKNCPQKKEEDSYDEDFDEVEEQ